MQPRIEDLDDPMASKSTYQKALLLLGKWHVTGTILVDWHA
jgi:hypothetical protein